jgi:hypothetical protein
VQSDKSSRYDYCDAGFASRSTLALCRFAGGKAKGRKAKFAVIEVDCLDICPKNAVMVVRAAAPGEWAAVPKGTSAAGVIERLGPARAVT